MRRRIGALLAALIAAVLALFVGPLLSSVAVVAQITGANYVYDTDHTQAQLRQTTSERGPPASVGLTTVGGLVAAKGSSGAAKTAAGASNAANGVRLAQQLARESAESAFTASGGLRTEVIQGSSRIIDGSRLGNPDVVKALTADGSNIADWGKYTTQTFQSPSGPFQVHFYYNPVTGAAHTRWTTRSSSTGMPR